MENNRGGLSSAEEYDLEPFTMVHDILKNLIFILLGALAAAMISYVVMNIKYVPQYTSSATFIVGSKDSNYTYRNVNSAYEMAQMFGKILQSNTLEKMLCEQMGVESIESEIKAEVVEDTNMIMLSVTADNPKEAYDTILAVMNNYTLVPFYALSGATMNVLVEPQVPFSPDNSINIYSIVKKAFLAGACLCIFLFGMLSYMQNTVKQEKEIEKKLDARSLGSISYERKYKTLGELIRHKKGSILVDNPIAGFSFVESYRRLASKLEYQFTDDKGKVLVVTSAAENEGKSTVAANLAITYAEQGKRVILLDGDIRRPSQFLIFGLNYEEENEFGEYLDKPFSASKIIIKGERSNLYFIGGKNSYASSTERLHAEALPLLLQACKTKADIIIIDTPPAGLIADAQIFGQYADGVLLVVKQNYMHAEDINEILDDFRDNHANVLGVVLNGVQTFSNILGLDVGNYYGKYKSYSYHGKSGRDRGI